MADRRRAVVGAALCSLLVTTGCAGVPETGAIHRTAAAPNGAVGADTLVEQAQGPQKGASQEEIVDSMLAAMSEGDDDAVKEFFTPGYYTVWQATEDKQTTIFSSKVGPAPIQKGADSVSVSFTVTGIIDEDQSYQRAGGAAPVTFTLTQLPQGWRISGINVPGSFVTADSLPQVDVPVRLYFPSMGADVGATPRLVPDTIFLPTHSNDPTYSLDTRAADIVRQLVGGPSGWLRPAVEVTVPEATTVLGVHVDPRTDIATVNLSAQQDRSGIPTLKAQLAYTLQPLLEQGEIQLELAGAAVGTPFSVQQGVSPAYDPDGLSADAPLYYLSAQDTVVSLAPGQLPEAAGSGTSGENLSQSNVPTTVLDHAAGVKQIAVSAVPDDAGSTPIAGTLEDQGAALLEVSTLGNAGTDPWTAVTIPNARHLSTPSFSATGDAVWTVATAADGTSALYRTPLSDGTPGLPAVVSVSYAPGSAPEVLSAFKLSRDGARAALVAGGQTYVAVVAPPGGAGSGAGSGAGTGWTVGGARPVISVDTKTADVDVYWDDRSTLGVVVQKGADTSLVTVSADGYTRAADGTVTDHVLIAGDYTGATQFAGGPGQLWVASLNGSLTRQPTPDASGDNPEPDDSTWVPLDSGSWPTYAG